MGLSPDSVLKFKIGHALRVTVFIKVNFKMFTKVSALADIHAPFFGPVFS